MQSITVVIIKGYNLCRPWTQRVWTGDRLSEIVSISKSRTSAADYCDVAGPVLHMKTKCRGFMHFDLGVHYRPEVFPLLKPGSCKFARN